jgi:mannose-6-phosphate isomerase-like protein (cupin superfamily)
MHEISMTSHYTKYTFRGRSGWIVDPRVRNLSHNYLGLGHTAAVSQWSDPCLHLHRESEEYYLLLRGELQFCVAGVLVTLQPDELLMVLPQVPHAVIGGQGPIEHFGFRTPFVEDKQIVGEIPPMIPVADENGRAIKTDWGSRIPLSSVENQNCWLIGWGEAKHASGHLILAYLNFPTHEEANAGLRTRSRMHHHQRSWEYYVSLRGRKFLEIEDEKVCVEAGEILEVPPKVRHNVNGREAPYEGFTIRVPASAESDKVENSAHQAMTSVH